MLSVLGIDPGFAECGHAEVQVGERGKLTVVRLGIIRTTKSQRRQKVLAADDQTRRLRELSSLLGMLIGDADVVCSEALSDGHGNAATSKLLGMSWGVVVTHAQLGRKPLLMVSPQQLRERLGLKGNAGKEAVQDAMCERFGKKVLVDLLSNVPSSKRVHAYDALAAAVACLDSEQVRLAMAVSSAADKLRA